MSRDVYNLQRFIDAQADVYDSVRAELQGEQKRGHWMWFIFPQIAGLGNSSMARNYALSSLREAQAYYAHPVLGARLLECTRIMNAAKSQSAQDILGGIDSLKFRSSMTLFARAVPDEGAFRGALRKYFDGNEDPLTLEKI